MSSKMKILAVTAAAAALLATVAVAHTVQTRVAANAHATTVQAIAPIPHGGPFVRHDNFACALASAAECEKIEALMPK
jgi:hypothetical protein